MQNEVRVRHEIRRALEPVVTPAPWLTANIRSTLRGGAIPHSLPRGLLSPRTLSGLKAAAAILLVIALAAALVVGSRILNRPHSVPGIQVDPATKHYRGIVDADFAPVERFVLSDLPRTCNEAKAADCKERVAATKAAIQKFRDDLASTKVPPALAGHNVVLNKGLSKMGTVIDAMDTALDRRNFTAYAEGIGQLFDTKLDVLYPMVVAVDCWPKAAIHGQDSAGYDVIRCGTTTAARDYLTVVYRDWDSLRGSINAYTDLCSGFGSVCRERTAEAIGLVDQFQSDLNEQLVPAQFGSADADLRHGLDTLKAKLTERIAAIDAGDRARWDKANVAVEQAKVNVIARAVGEMACWPRDVHIGDDSSTTAWPCAS